MSGAACLCLDAVRPQPDAHLEPPLEQPAAAADARRPPNRATEAARQVPASDAPMEFERWLEANEIEIDAIVERAAAALASAPPSPLELPDPPLAPPGGNRPAIQIATGQHHLRCLLRSESLVCSARRMHAR